MKKLISIFILVLLSITLSIPVSAAESDFTSNGLFEPNFTYIWSISAGLSISSAGKAQCSGSVDASSNSYTANLTVSLQKSNGSGGWTTVKSWSGSGAGQSGLIVEGNYYVEHGTYRVASTAKIYSSAGKLLESETFHSAEKTY